MKIIAIRHGETEGNVAGTLQGHLPGKLTPNGRDQVEEAAHALKDFKFAAIYSSDLHRTRETTAIIAKHHPDAPIEYTPALRETGFGVMEGTAYADVDWAYVREDFYNGHFEGGESFNDIRTRLSKFLNTIRKLYQPDDHVLLVTHAGTIRVLKGLFKAIDEETFWAESIPNASQHELEVVEELSETFDI